MNEVVFECTQAIIGVYNLPEDFRNPLFFRPGIAGIDDIREAEEVYAFTMFPAGQFEQFQSMLGLKTKMLLQDFYNLFLFGLIVAVVRMRNG